MSKKRILLTGLWGGITIMAWTFIANGLLGFNARIRMNRIPDEAAVYQVLKEHVIAPGAYTVNPEVEPGSGFPAGEPVFRVHYSGFGHEAAGRLVLVETGIAFVSAVLIALLLSLASDRVLSRYSGRVLFVALIGLFAAVFGELTKYGIGGYPLGSTLLLGANSLIAWTLAGLVMARSMPAQARRTSEGE